MCKCSDCGTPQRETELMKYDGNTGGWLYFTGPMVLPNGLCRDCNLEMAGSSYEARMTPSDDVIGWQFPPPPPTERDYT